MSRPTHVFIDPEALLHNAAVIRTFAPGKKLIAMVKANAYGCGLTQVAPVLKEAVDAFGVACLDEALIIRSLGIHTLCILFNGVFDAEEYIVAAEQKLACVLHQQRQLQWLINTPLKHPLSVWVKVNTGMNRLGFKPEELSAVIAQLKACPWVQPDLGLMTHLACADEPSRRENTDQITLFQRLHYPEIQQKSIANSAAMVAFPHAQEDAVRCGIMLYGVSPFATQTGRDLGLKPVMHLSSVITAIHMVSPGSSVGYGGRWHCKKESIIGIVPVGYGDGYPRHIQEGTPVWVAGKEIAIVGRVSMDMIAIDITSHADIQIGDSVELWGTHLPIERIAASCDTIAYELLCQVTERPRHQAEFIEKNLRSNDG